MLSTAFAFDLSRDNVINLALANLGVIGPGGTPTAEQRTHAANWLNILAKSLDEDNKYTWRVRDKTVALVAGTGDYVLGADVTGVDSCTYIRTGTTSRQFMWAMSHDEYHKLPDLTTQGTPSQFWAERTVSTAGFTLHVYPVPDAASLGTVEAHVTVRAMDYTTGANTGDFPQGWLSMLVFGLTAMLAPTYGQPEMVATYQPLFQGEREKVIAHDNEDVPFQIVPFGGF